MILYAPHLADIQNTLQTLLRCLLYLNVAYCYLNVAYCILTMLTVSLNYSRSLRASPFPYKEAIGSLIYLMMCTRPDITYAVGQAARFSQNPEKAHWSAVKRILSYLSGTLNHGILFSSKGRAHYGFTDADYAGCLDSRKSTSGFLFLHLGGAVAWGSHRQTCTATSTTEAEYIAASDATKEAIWLRRLLIQIDSFPTNPVRLMCDNQSSIRLVHNPVHHNRTKHIQIRFHFIREKQEKGEIDIVYVTTTHQLADIFTKPLPIP